MSDILTDYPPYTIQTFPAKDLVKNQSFYDPEIYRQPLLTFLNNIDVRHFSVVGKLSPLSRNGIIYVDIRYENCALIVFDNLDLENQHLEALKIRLLSNYNVLNNTNNLTINLNFKTFDFAPRRSLLYMLHQVINLGKVKFIDFNIMNLTSENYKHYIYFITSVIAHIKWTYYNTGELITFNLSMYVDDIKHESLMRFIKTTILYNLSDYNNDAGISVYDYGFVPLTMYYFCTNINIFYASYVITDANFELFNLNIHPEEIPEHYKKFNFAAHLNRPDANTTRAKIKISGALYPSCLTFAENQATE